MNRINLITLGVKDMSRSLRFYKEGLGFQTAVSEESPAIVFFNNAGTKLALYPLDALAKDINEQEPPQKTGFSGITLAYNTKSEEEVNQVIEQAKQAGATIVKAPERVFWGGYSGYFSDPDGYVWEVAYGESWEFDQNEMLVIK
ncbi:VOC family protein [Halalkalibacter akibai]|uniref:Lactoylglutathione lyase n=1 Tax=Halalkalibacter akibai (strain ATCC 43226 / DSM 21942 / CIP 109018 / JCM 9157 / 1139) TaxID=1236973 RepID=W4QWD7_HALA3|nr:VOC family protein [Halalkalibacter akibai]GAE35953.1 lactoylglutathione lyase [Halalkalibacter akibai JCM 9157]